jgi:hypothetical protein
MKRWTKGLCALTVAVGVLGPAALARAQDARNDAVVDIPMTTCSGSFSVLLEFPASDSGERTIEAALDDYFQESQGWTSTPAVASDMRTATSAAVARGGWVQTEVAAGEPATFANLVSDGEVVARFFVEQLPDKTWRVEGFDYCPSAAKAAGLVLQDGA